MDPRVLHRPAPVAPSLLTSSLGENASLRIGETSLKNRWQVLEEEMQCLLLAFVYVPRCEHPHVTRSPYKQRSAYRTKGLIVLFSTDFVLFLFVWC